ncbi:hypothetical protein [uncultured Apibacter sp.]|uniref:hypothetical protein n=1 Tax=uncultured Apibacter sp. TaxID=1778616 RepID=UPI0025CE09A1|nr:hypothetical protein [uncultured Apibacter sp.]
MSYNLELQKINLKLYSITNPDDKIILLKQAILLADSNNDIEWGFDFRLELINEEVRTSRCIESFPAFTWLLETYDKNPEIFDEKELLWQYKWLAQASYRNSNIEKEQIEKIFEDLKSRMTKNGYSLRGYYSVIIGWYDFIGDIESMDAYIELREKDTRDDMSHCMACELDIRVESELKKGNVDRAIDIAHDLFVKKLSCAHMPFATFCKFAYYLNKLGDSRAADFYEKAMYELKENIDEKYETFLSTISLLINYLIYNDREKAFELFEKYSPWDFNSEDSLQFDFSVNVLNLFNVEGSRKIRISATHPLYSDSGEYNLKDLYSYYYNRALDLAHKFDARNKTDNFKNLLTKETMSK